MIEGFNPQVFVPDSLDQSDIELKRRLEAAEKRRQEYIALMGERAVQAAVEDMNLSDALPIQAL